MKMSPIDRFVFFIEERECVRLRREARQPRPWSDDPILQQWRFTNVRREDDRVTRWIAEHMRDPNADDPYLFFAMVVARFVNWPDTLAEIGYPVPWDRDHFLAVMADRKARGETAYGSAYMIRADARLGRPTARYQAEDVFGPLWRDREKLRPRTGETLAGYHRRLGAYHGMGDGFMPAQVIADLKFVEPLLSASDWQSFAVSGPGSRRGLNLVLGRDENAPWTEAEWRREFDKLQREIAPDLESLGLRDLSAQDLQNCLCEFAKYERARRGGKLKRKFAGEGIGGLLQIAPPPRERLPELRRLARRQRQGRGRS